MYRTPPKAAKNDLPDPNLDTEKEKTIIPSNLLLSEGASNVPPGEPSSIIVSNTTTSGSNTISTSTSTNVRSTANFDFPKKIETEEERKARLREEKMHVEDFFQNLQIVDDSKGATPKKPIRKSTFDHDDSVDFSKPSNQNTHSLPNLELSDSDLFKKFKEYDSTPVRASYPKGSIEKTKRVQFSGPKYLEQIVSDSSRDKTLKPSVPCMGTEQLCQQRNTFEQGYTDPDTYTQSYFQNKFNPLPKESSTNQYEQNRFSDTYSQPVFNDVPHEYDDNIFNNQQGPFNSINYSQRSPYNMAQTFSNPMNNNFNQNFANNRGAQNQSFSSPIFSATIRDSYIRRLRSIPIFNGSSYKDLREFLDVTDTLRNACLNEQELNEFYEQAILQLRGEAKRVISGSEYSDWNVIKRKLISHFSYLANKDIITSQLENLKQEKDESLTKFAERARKLLQEKDSMYTHLTSDQKFEHNRMARKSFIKGIQNDKLRERLAIRGASSLEDAISFSIEMETDAMTQIPKYELFYRLCSVNGHRENQCRRRNNNADFNGVISALQALNSNSGFRPRGIRPFNNNNSRFGWNRPTENMNSRFNMNNNRFSRPNMYNNNFPGNNMYNDRFFGSNMHGNRFSGFNMNNYRFPDRGFNNNNGNYRFQSNGRFSGRNDNNNGLNRVENSQMVRNEGFNRNNNGIGNTGNDNGFSQNANRYPNRFNGRSNQINLVKTSESVRDSEN
ncbi:putative uncharacterized protein DDB_G0289263 [Contarinia nasturtii]|uniref:putative uncharacterized protein DDB_G0289263 n=1 Tax=Contarinia nasturtii TaxID=265458 RepID=UPI0012D4C38B|nr:putative uncharacterized protein DDB_G0289263 [Contarinia nasturtii]